MPLPPSKPLTKLFKCVGQTEYARGLERLADLRSAYPDASNEELLLRLYLDSENNIRVAKWRTATLLSRPSGA